jgi:hypothetical protein
MTDRPTPEQIERALTWWDFDVERPERVDQRDHIVALLEKYYDPDQPYHVVDRIFDYLDDIRARVDETIMAVMDDKEHWGHFIPDRPNVTMQSFVFGRATDD